MADLLRFFDDVLTRAMAEVRASGIDVFTFAFYHDHESAAVSICIDTKVNSAQRVIEHNDFIRDIFAESVSTGDLRMAEAAKANVGRSLSLGDFVMVNVVRTDIGSVQVDDNFYMDMIRTVQRRESEIAAMTTDVSSLVLCASSAEWEVGYTWTVQPAGAK